MIQVTIGDILGQIIIARVESIEKAFELIKSTPNVETYHIKELYEEITDCRKSK